LDKATTRKIMRKNYEVNIKEEEEDAKLEEEDDFDDDDEEGMEDLLSNKKRDQSKDDPFEVPDNDEEEEERDEEIGGDIESWYHTEHALPGDEELENLLRAEVLDEREESGAAGYLEELEIYHFLGMRIVKEFQRLEDADLFGNDLDFGNHPLAENMEFTDLHDHAKERADELEGFHLENEPYLPQVDDNYQ
jgi:hypothetical protein